MTTIGRNALARVTGGTADVPRLVKSIQRTQVVGTILSVPVSLASFFGTMHLLEGGSKPSTSSSR